MRITLPEHPIDRHEVIAWRVDAEQLKLHELRWRYHVQRKCVDVIGVAGTDWIHDWEVVAFGRCQGRISGWHSLPRFIDDRCHLSIEAAREELKRLVLERDRSLRLQLDELQSKHRGWLAPDAERANVTRFRDGCLEWPGGGMNLDMLRALLAPAGLQIVGVEVPR